MYCRRCGTLNDDNAYKCVQCGEILQGTVASAGPPPQRIPNYLVQSIIVTLLCCLPLGIVGIVYAAQVNGKIQLGDYEGALDFSKKAKMWTWISFGLGLVGGLLYFVLVLIGEAVKPNH